MALAGMMKPANCAMAERMDVSQASWVVAHLNIQSRTAAAYPGIAWTNLHVSCEIRSAAHQVPEAVERRGQDIGHRHVRRQRNRHQTCKAGTWWS